MTAHINDREPGCPACGARAYTPETVRGHALFRCSGCGLRWLVDPPRGDELDRLYTVGFYAGMARGGPLVEILHSVNGAIRMRDLAGFEQGRLLDVGSGKGRFLAAARDAGWQACGVEFAPSAVRFARERFELDVVLGDFLTAPLSGPFDVVTMWHTLEHLADPRAAARRAFELLRPGGHLVVSVPNNSSLQARLGGEAWFHLDLPRHLFHFTPLAITSLLARAGFAVEHIGYFYPEMEVIGLVQTILNRAGLGKDSLYRFAKRDDTVEPSRVLASAALAAILIPGALAWSVLAPALRAGASMQVVATRR